MHWQFIWRYDTHTAQEPGSLFWFHAVMSLQHSCPLFFLLIHVVKLTSGLFYDWSLLRNNNMVTNLRRFTSNNGRRRFAACACWPQTSWHVMQRDGVCWERKACSVILREMKHGWIRSNTTKILKNPLLVWDRVTNVPELSEELNQTTFM